MTERRSIFAIAVLTACLVCTLPQPLRAQGEASNAGETRPEGGAGPSVQAEVSIEPGSGTVGDRFVYSIESVRGDSTVLIYPDVVEAAAAFGVVDVVDHPARETDGTVAERRDYIVAAFETGRQTIPSLELRAVAGHETLSVVLDSVSITIKSVLPDTMDQASMEPMDIEPPVDLPREIWPFILVACIAAAAVLAWWLIRRYVRPWWRRPREVAEEPAAVPRVAAHLVAFERLSELRADDPVGRGDLDEFYVRVTSILKSYVRDRYGVDVVDMTTEEVGPAMRASRTPENDTVWFEKYLRHADLPKFARVEPATERARADLDDAWSFVERTRLSGEEAES